MIKELKEKVKELLDTKKVDLVIGYRRASDGIAAQPFFLQKEGEAEALVWDAYCYYNLSGYLRDFPGKKVGLVAKACDLKSIIVLLQEHQLKRENLYIIGMDCSGMIDESKLLFSSKSAQEINLARKCKFCQNVLPAIYDVLIRENEKKDRSPVLEQDKYEGIRKLGAKSLTERLKFWEGEFSRCIRCYACRQICPLCYCPKCVADQTMPTWFSKAANLKGNFSWNVVRALHQAGRCIDCGECERACPVGIPLTDINRKIEKDIQELFNYEAGVKVEQKPLLVYFDKNDPEDFIR
jgi:formate dehydrogenase (coenzyme F420) beta subunit